MFAWPALDPKVTAEVILILAQRLSRRGDRAPKVGFDGRELLPDGRAPPQTFVPKVVGKKPGIPVQLRAGREMTWLRTGREYVRSGGN
jgi:hypothetical protein